MIFCPAYGIDIVPVQCAAARKQFFWSRLCGDCPGRNCIIEKPLEMITGPPMIISRIGGVLRTGPTIETALRGPMVLQKTVQNIPKIFQKPAKPRCKLPPGMTPAVARAMGLLLLFLISLPLPLGPEKPSSPPTLPGISFPLRETPVLGAGGRINGVIWQIRVIKRSSRWSLEFQRRKMKPGPWNIE